jgi:hypothetical protein
MERILPFSLCCRGAALSEPPAQRLWPWLHASVPAITVEMAKAFTLYMVKAVMSGRTDEIVDLVQGNLWR